jgi:hypothetical protein
MTIFDRIELEWMAESLEQDGFWHQVDSTPGFTMWNRHGWPEERDAEWCMAANSDRKRCGQRATGLTPFCHFHSERAMLAFISLAIRGAERDAEAMLKWRRDAIEVSHGKHMAALGYEHALRWDAAEAGRRLSERVYFYAADYAVKIGRSINPEQRVKTLGATKAPTDVNVRSGELIGTIPGGCHVESKLHEQFRQHRLVGEWFRLKPIRSDIDALIANEVAA